MKTGLGLKRKYRSLYAILNLFRFWWRKTLLGFDIANQFAQRVDNISLQLILKNNGATIGKDCDIETGLIFHNCKNYSNLIIGDNCHIGKNCFFDLRDKITIKDNVVISMQCTFITHIDMNKSELSKKYSSNSKEIIIENDCYLGANVEVLKGVTIGQNSMVASMSLVNSDIKVSIKVAGIPAKQIIK